MLNLLVGTLLAATGTQALEKAVTFHQPAATVDRVLANLSKAGGVKVAADAEMARDVVLVDVKEAPLQDILLKIATVTAGRWKQEEDGSYLLTADRTARGVQERLDLEEKVKQVRETLASAPTPPQIKTDDPAMQAKILAAFARPLTEGILPRLYPFLDLNAIAKLRSGERIVFSTSPNSMQMPFVGLTPQVLAQAIAQHNQDIAERTRPGGNVRIMRLPRTAAPLQMPAKVLVAVGRNAFGGFGIRLTFLDARGQVTHTSSGMNAFTLHTTVVQPDGVAMDVPGNGTWVMGASPKAKAEPLSKPEGASITYSPMAQEVLLTLSNFSGRTIKISREALARVCDPVQFDPLSLAPSEALLATAKEAKTQIVACVPDEIIAFFRANPGKITTGQFVKGVAPVLTLENKEGWMLGTPKRPADARLRRADRPGLAALMKAYVTNGVLSLADISAYALRAEAPPAGLGALDQEIICFTYNSSNPVLARPQTWALYRLYGSFTSDQRKAFEAGQGISFSNLNALQTQLATSVVFADQARVKRLRLQSASTEITELLPNGLPKDGHLKTTFISEPAVRLVYKDPTLLNPAMAVTAGQYGGAKSPVGPGTPMPPAKMVAGTRTTYAVDFVPVGGFEITETISDDRIPTNGAVVEEQSLPTPFLTKVNEIVRRNQEMINKMSSRGGSKVAPPP